MRPDFGKLYPFDYEKLKLPSGATCCVLKSKLLFSKWNGAPIPNYNGKPIVDYEGQPLFAEIVILRMLEAAGWRGFWIDSFGSGGYRSDLPHRSVARKDIGGTPPATRYPNGFLKLGGGWDVVAWKGESVIFVESKRKRDDKIRATQLSWLESRLRDGASEDDFILAEWTLPDEKRPATFEIREGGWYAYQMLPGYAGPYLSPIRVEGVRKSGRKVELRFYNAGYADGVRNFHKHIQITSIEERRLTGALDDAVEKRSVTIAEIDREWLSRIIPEHFLQANPMSREEAASNDFQGYLNRLHWASEI